MSIIFIVLFTVDGFIFVGINFGGMNNGDPLVVFKIGDRNIFIHK